MSDKIHLTDSSVKRETQGEVFQHNDVVLNREGVFTHFSKEVSQILQENSSTQDVFTLRRFLLEIEVDSDALEQDCASAIGRCIRNSSVHWNVVDVSSSRLLQGQPKVFNALKPTRVLKAARKAGVLPSSNSVFASIIFLVFILSGGLILLVKRWITSVPPGLNSLRDMLLSPAANGGYLALWGLLLITGIVLAAYVSGKMMERNAGLWKQLAAKVQNADEVDGRLEQFRKEVINELSLLDMPRMLLVGVDQLDRFSTETLYAHLRDEGNSHTGLSVWILFVKSGTKAFSPAMKEMEGHTKVVSLKHKCYQMVRTC